MHFIAVPANDSQIAPILDFSPWILIVNGQAANNSHETKLYVKGLSPRQVANVLMEARVKTVICGCLSTPLYDCLVRSGIHVVWGVTGPIKKVVETFEAGGLDDSRYRVVGLGETRFRPFEMPLWPCTGQTHKGDGHRTPFN